VKLSAIRNLIQIYGRGGFRVPLRTRHPSVGERLKAGIIIFKYVVSGSRPHFDPSPAFDTKWYLEQYPDVAAAHVNPLVHFFTVGAVEGRHPHPLFDTSWYLQQNPDVAAAGINPLLHYVTRGAHEGRDPHPLFDSDWYLAQNPDVAAAGINPLAHYLAKGAAAERDPNPDFDGAWYLRENRDVAVAGINPLVHYVTYGAKEGRRPSLAVDPRPQGEDIYALSDLCSPTRAENPIGFAFEGFGVSVLTPTYNTNPKLLAELHQSLRNQSYSDWEWVIVDDASSDPKTIEALATIAARDSRIKITLLSKNGGISLATNKALSLATKPFVALVDHDDLLSRDALERVALEWRGNPLTDLFYTDECKLSDVGRIYDISLKPGPSPALLECTMYIGHLSVYRREFVRALGGFRSEYDGTQDYDLALRAFAATKKIRHVDGICYLWRAVPESSAASLNAKSGVIELQRKAVSEAVSRRCVSASVTPGVSLGFWHVDFALPDNPPTLSFVIPTAAGSRLIRGEMIDLVANAIDSLDRAEVYPNCEYVVIHNGNLSAQQDRYLSEHPRVRLVEYAGSPFNFAEKINLGVASATGDFICLLNDDTEAITPHGGCMLIAYMLAAPGVGAIGPMLLFEDGKVQHNGIVLLEGGPSHYGIMQSPDFGGHANVLQCRRECVGVTGAFLIVRREIYLRLGGFRTSLPFNYNDVDFCLRLGEAGLSCVVDPAVRVYHFEGSMKLGNVKCEKETLYSFHPGLKDVFFNAAFDQRDPSMRVAPRHEARGDHSDPISFENWLDRHICERIPAYPAKGTIKLTVGMPVFNQPSSLLKEAYLSFNMQTYANKELVIVDDGSSRSETVEWIRSIELEGRATIARHETNRGIMGANRTLVASMTGDFLLPLDADDFITIDALQVMAHFIERNPGADLFYSDEFKSDMKGRKFAPFYKPAFDPILLMNCCYPAHLMAIRRDFLHQIHAYDDDRATWCHDWDTLTRGLADNIEPVHVPELLYAWRINPGSTASLETGTKRDAVASQQYVLERFIKTKGLEDVVAIRQNDLFFHEGMWRLAANKIVEDVTILDAGNLWSKEPRELASELMAVCATEAGYAAILPPAADVPSILKELSAPFLFDPRVIAVSGLLLNGKNDRVLWSGGFLHANGVMDPYAGLPFDGGYHGQLFCQRCVDVPAPVGLLIRKNVLASAIELAGEHIDADRLMISLGLLASRLERLICVTPHVLHRMVDGMDVVPVDRHSIARGTGLHLSRWYGKSLSSERPYCWLVGAS
jgi:glycosyltransferase involved in cell wall biosynthesis